MSNRGSIDRTNLSRKVADRLRERILTLALTPGDRLVVDNLAEEHGVSRTPVREALLELVSDGLVRYDGKSYRISVYLPQDVRDLFGVRKSLEALSSYRAALKISEIGLKELEELCRYSEEHIGDGEKEDELIETDLRFHEAVAEASGNSRLKMVLDKVRRHHLFVRKWLYPPSWVTDSEPRTSSEHRRITDALAARNPDQARAAMIEHLRRAERRTLAWFDRHPVPEAVEHANGGNTKQAVDPISRKHLSEQVAERIKSRILDLDIEPGARLIVEELASNMAVSRTPVREGLRRLALDGLVHYDGYVYRVAEYADRDIEELFEVRRVLESLAAEQAATHISNGTLDELGEVYEQGRECLTRGDSECLIALDARFHELIVESGGNPYLRDLLSVVQDQHRHVRRWLFARHLIDFVEQQTLEEHLSIIRSLESREAGTAARRMVNHLSRAESRIIEVLREA